MPLLLCSVLMMTFWDVGEQLLRHGTNPLPYGLLLERNQPQQQKIPQRLLRL